MVNSSWLMVSGKNKKTIYHKSSTINQTGFTLIELLVTITIIAILAAVGSVVYSSAQKTARISKRIQDLKAIQASIELYKTSTGKYPIQTLFACAPSILSPTYMSSIPTDPYDQAMCYLYQSDSNGLEYKIATNDDLVSAAEMKSSDYLSRPEFIDPAQDADATPNCIVNTSGNIYGWALYQGTNACAYQTYDYSQNPPSPAPPNPPPGPPAPPPPNPALANGLVGYWEMEETSTSAVDSSGSNNSGSWSGNLSPISGKIGNGLFFDNSTTYLNVADSNSLDLTSDFTIAAWINLNSNNNFNQIVAKEAVSTVTPSSYGFSISSSAQLSLTIFTIADNVDTGAPVTTGVWSHVAISRLDSLCNFYLNGSLNSTVNCPDDPTANTSSLLIGKRAGSCCFFDGAMDELRIYNRALSTLEITDLYNLTQPYP